MLSIGLWCWYINITITILDIIHRPVFYLKLNWTQLYKFVRTSYETHLRPRYEPNRLMLSIGLWLRYIDVRRNCHTYEHYPSSCVLLQTRHFGGFILSRIMTDVLIYHCHKPIGLIYHIFLVQHALHLTWILLLPSTPSFDWCSLFFSSL
jgi:hypothetical protein